MGDKSIAMLDGARFANGQVTTAEARMKLQQVMQVRPGRAGMAHGHATRLTDVRVALLVDTWLYSRRPTPQSSARRRPSSLAASRWMRSASSWGRPSRTRAGSAEVRKPPDDAENASTERRRRVVHHQSP